MGIYVRSGYGCIYSELELSDKRIMRALGYLEFCDDELEKEDHELTEISCSGYLMDESAIIYDFSDWCNKKTLTKEMIEDSVRDTLTKAIVSSDECDLTYDEVKSVIDKEVTQEKFEYIVDLD